MVQERVSGNGNFDIDAITRLVNADANAPALIEQPFVDPVADAFAADVQDTADEIRHNPGSNLAEEAMQIMNAPGVAKLGAGVMADLRAAVQLQEEKAANGADAFMRGDRVWEERKERDDKDRKEQARIADFADDAQNATQRMTPEQWDQAPSREYPGMTNAEALSAIRRINGNLPFYSQMAVQRGLIREDERPEFERLMQVRERMLVAERNGNTNTAEHQADRRSWETAPQNLRTATTDIVVLANERGADAPTPVVAGASGNAIGSAARNSEVDALSVDGGGPPSAAPTVPVSVAANLDRVDGATADRMSLASTFNSSASGASAPQPPAAVVAPTAPAPPRVAAAGFDQSTGMI